MIFVYFFIGLLILLALIASLMPKGFNRERSIIIQSPVEKIMNHVGDLRHYREWNPWLLMEPEASDSFSGEPNSLGRTYQWVGKKIGTGRLTLLSLDKKHIHLELAFIRPWKTKAKDNWLFEHWRLSDTKFEHWRLSDTKVIWQNSGPLLTKSLNKMFEKGLQNLKTTCEENK